MGINARLNKPGQGVFVYNKEYEDAGKEDHYDFYFTGRFADWEYYNMDIAMGAAMDMVSKYKL